MAQPEPRGEFLPFARPDIGEAEIAEVVDSLRSGWLSSGPKVRLFERQFGDFLGDGIETVAINSATAGLHLALEALGTAPSDEVIVPVHTFTSTAAVIRHLGARPVFVDVDRERLTIDVAAVNAAITARTRAVMPVHYGGLPCDMPALTQLAQRHGFAIVEDAAHSLPARTSDGRLVGTLDSAATVFSFYANKTMTTGEGGMIATRSPELAARARVMRLHGINRDAFDRFQGSKGNNWYYEVVAPGFKYNLTDIAAALGIQQLRRAESMRQRRAAIAAAYDAAFRDLPLDRAAQPRGSELHAWHLYVVRLRRDAALTRNDFIASLHAAGIGTSVHYVPLQMHPYWRDTFGLRAEAFPVSTDAYERGVSLPIYSLMSDADVERVVTAVQRLLG